MRFCGEVGYGESKETPPGSGNWVDEITEVTYRGDVVRTSRQLDSTANLNPDIGINNSISIVADEYALSHYFNMRYVMFEGARWTVRSVEVRSPRLILTLGELYNGPTP